MTNVDKVALLRNALLLAINTVECQSIDTATGEELPWYANAKEVLRKVSEKYVE